MKRKPSALVRLNTDPLGLDEIVVGDWLHVEAMCLRRRVYQVRIGSKTVEVSIDKKTGAVTTQEMDG